MKVSEGKEAKQETVLDQLKRKNLSVMQINALTRVGRDDLMEIISTIFSEYSLNPEFLFNIYSAIVEVIFNGLKANYKYISFKQEIRKKFTHELGQLQESSDVIDTVFEIDALRDFLRRYVPTDKLKKTVHTLMKTDERIRLGDHTLTKEEVDKILDFKDAMNKENMSVHLTIAIGEKWIIFSVVNNSPILDKDLERINLSRSTHNKLASEGNSAGYFSPEYLDGTESAGMGIALADEVYYDLSLDPLELFTINTKEEKTVAILRFPRNLLTLSL